MSVSSVTSHIRCLRVAQLDWLAIPQDACEHPACGLLSGQIQGMPMQQDRPVPGITRSERLSEEGLKRLEKQLATGAEMSGQVLAQWIRKYGEPAREIIKKHGRYRSEFDA